MVKGVSTGIFCLVLTVLAAGFGSCGARTGSLEGGKAPIPFETPAGEALPGVGLAGETGNLLALVIPGAFPLWFDLNGPVPVPVDTPEETALTPFEPWPHARHIGGMIPQGEGLIMALNQEGALILLPQGEALALHRLSPEEPWKPYTVGTVFRYQDIPAILLYRDDFFIPSAVDSPGTPPVNRVWGLAEGGLRLVPLEIPAFTALPSQEGWDLEELRFGRDGLWYYRGVRESNFRMEVRYFCTTDLEVSGKPSSAGLFRNASVPYTSSKAPRLLGMVLEEADRLVPGAITGVVASIFPRVRYYTGRSDGTSDGRFNENSAVVELSGFYRESPGMEALAVLGFPDGRLVYAGEKDGEARLRVASLPPLPEGFVYTRLGMAGPALIAAWEEQRDWNIGASGFLVITIPEGSDFY